MPSLVLTDGPARRDLRSYCSARTPLVVYLSSPKCPFCARFNPEIESLAAHRHDFRVVKLVVGGQSRRVPDRAANMQVAAAAPGAVAAAFRVNVVPAVIATDTACRIRAAGAGLNASRAVLQQATEPSR